MEHYNTPVLVEKLILRQLREQPIILADPMLHLTLTSMEASMISACILAHCRKPMSPTYIPMPLAICIPYLES